MFYSVELLTLRKNAKFVKCWLAATWSRKLFCYKFRPNTIKAIDLVKMCDELIIYTAHRQFSIYLSSQLLCGATRILYYQADILLNDLLECRVKTTSKTKSGKKPDEELQISQQLRDVPELTDLDFSGNLVDNERRITLAEPSDWVSDVPMSTFGAITEKELDYILQHDGLIPLDLSDSVRKLPDLPETSIPESEDANLFKKPTLPPVQQIQTETMGLLEGQGVDQSLLEIQETTSEQLPEPPQEVALTPTKRTRSSPGIDGHKTPTKKRRELDTEPGSVLTPVPPRIEQPSDSFTLQSLITDGQEGKKTNQRSKRSKIIDEITQISLPRPDIFIQSVRNDVIQLPKQTANKLLTIPSTNSRHWGKGLLNLYENMLLNPMSHSAIEPIANPEVVLGPVSAIHTTTDVTADGLPIHGTLLENTSKTNGTKTIEQISIDHTIQVPLTESWPINVTNDFPQPLPETSVKEPHATSKMISDHPHSEIINTVYSDWLENGENGNFRVPLMDKGTEKSPTVEVRVARYQSRSSKTSSGSTILSTGNLVKSNLLGYLHALWSTNQVLTFKDLVPLSTSTKKDAIRMFSSLLELHKSKQVKLLQAEPYGHIYIQEYSMY